MEITLGRLLLLRHAPTPATRRRAFPADEEAEEEALSRAAELRDSLPPIEVAFVSPARRARQTAAALGIDAVTEPLLAEADFGAWAGRPFEEVVREDPLGVKGWLEDPSARPHGGESLEELAARASAFLDKVASLMGEGKGAVLAVTHSGFVRAACLKAIGAPLTSFWKIGVEPLSVTELAWTTGAWALVRLNWAPGRRERLEAV